MEGKIESAILINKMQCVYEKVIIGFSGGADSSALLHYLAKKAKSIICVHVNHMIRGAEADRDEAFCREVCEKYGVELACYKIDIPALAKARGEGIEETARKERYRIFESERVGHGFDAIATAHNANDNAESVIFNIARGSGTNGLCGIKPVNGKIIRPLIYASRAQILEYCEKNGIDYVTDSTNSDTDYTRNFIRHEIVPMLEKLNPSLTGAIERLTISVSDDERYLSELAGEFIKQNCPNGRIYKEAILSCNNSIVVRVLKMLSGTNLDSKSISACLDFIPRAQTGGVINLVNGVSLKCESEYFQFIKTTDLFSVTLYALLNEGVTKIEQTNEIITYNEELLDNKPYCIIRLSSDAVDGKLYARSRKDGDRIKHGKVTKQVKKLMCEKKIPSHLRDKIPLICDDNGILAIPEVAIRDGALGNDIILRLYKERN
ncbi:MAG: tRNA lysidine(34) synthetase TilS [Clostridia bacterium]|nr:tRNA lysidine(34) synthetase TilS [Clostridia bacterium]